MWHRLLEERMRETGWQQATQFKSKQKVRIYNFRETVSEFEDSHTAVILIKASKVNEMYTRKPLKCNTLYLKLNKVSCDASKRHVIPPQRGPCGWCGHVDSVEGQTLKIRYILVRMPSVYLCKKYKYIIQLKNRKGTWYRLQYILKFITFSPCCLHKIFKN